MNERLLALVGKNVTVFSARSRFYLFGELMQNTNAGLREWKVSVGFHGCEGSLGFDTAEVESIEVGKAELVFITLNFD